MRKKRLGELLQERGHISQIDLARAVAEQQGKVILLGELLLERGIVNKPQLISALEGVTSIPYVDCATISPDPAAIGKISRELALKCVALPAGQQGSKLVMVMAEPQNLALLDELKFTAGINVSPRFGFRHEILQAIEKHYAASADVDSAPQFHDDTDMEFISTSTRQANQEAIQETQAALLQKTTPAVKVVSEVIRAANDRRASDIHIEPQATEVIIRIRVDGVLRDLRRVPRRMQNNLISRIKILSDMDIAERRTPQDGRFMVRIGTVSIDMRVSTLPTQYGEKVVMRLLNTATGVVNFPDLCMSKPVEKTLRRMLAMPQGMLLVTGPTGSGKSTTLYASLGVIRHTAVNIVTVEDPVEYVLPGINQVQVNNRTGLTFATCLRSILRQDPNVIMVGEIRDKETAEIALKAAQTGHFVLSTLHTNDSFSAVTRLLDLGVPGFMIASSVTGIMAQRLVRRLCDCKQRVRATAENLERMALLGMTEPMDEFFSPVGCDACDHTGYRGRIGIYEMLVFDDDVREAIRTEVNGDNIRILMRNLGMKSMQEDALDKIQQGITSAEEVARVVPMHALDTSPLCPKCKYKIVATFRFCPLCGTKQHQTEVSTRREDKEETVAL